MGIMDAGVGEEVGWGVFVEVGDACCTGVGVSEGGDVAVTVASVVELIWVSSLTGVGVNISRVAPVQADRNQLRRASK